MLEPKNEAHMSEYLQEIGWREQYLDLTAGVGMIRNAPEQSFGPVASLPNAERVGTSIEDCQHIAEAILTYAAKLQCRVTQLEKALKQRELANAPIHDAARDFQQLVQIASPELQST